MTTLAETRQATFDFYRNHEDPRFCITLNQTLFDFRPTCKQAGISTFQFLLHQLAKTTLDIEHFRLRFDDNDTLFSIDSLNVSYTVLDGNGNANFVIVAFDDDLETFVKNSEIEKARVESSTDMGHPVDPRKNFLYVSAVPWISFTGIQNAYTNRRTIQIPIVVFGRFKSLNEKELILPISIQSHHGLIDGFHVAQFLERLQNNILDMCENL